MLEYFPEIGSGAVWLIVFLLAFVVQVYYYLFVFLRLSRYKQRTGSDFTPPVSVVICARNEEENLAAFIPLIMEQDYPDYEVIVVNDCSYDHSIDVLESLAKRYSGQHVTLKVPTIKEVEGREHGKKFALTIGIKAAVNEYLLLTDADCRPLGKNWIRSMMSGYTGNKEIVLGYGKYESGASLLNTIIRFDCFFIAVQYFSFALMGKPYMGVGRNLSYQRSLFFKVKGFASHIHLNSGDDDLFINQVADSQNTAVVISKDSATVSVPKKTWKSWFLQKKRHHTTARYYRRSHQYMLAFYPLSWYIFMIAAVGGLFYEKNMLIISIGLLLRIIIQIAILHTSAKKLGELWLGFLSPVLEVIHRIIVYPIYILSTMFVRRSRWN